MRKKLLGWIGVVSGAALIALVIYTPVTAKSDNEFAEQESRVQQGWEIAPVPLDTRGKNKALVGLGSYLVNAVGGCNDCHTWPNYAASKPDGSCDFTKGNPYAGQSEEINRCGYLAGGRPFPLPFGTFISANITPDENGLPAGLTFDEFRSLLGTGHDPHDTAHPNSKLQVMPWPAYRNMNERDLKAIYEYLGSIPSISGNR